MNFATAVLSGTICSPVQHLENGQVRFSLQNEEGIFLIKVPGLAQVRMCQVLGVGDVVYLFGHLHSFRSQKCAKHHVYFEAIVVIAQASTG
jgi:hypothetical protein